MGVDFIKKLMRCVLFVLVQVLVLNRVHLFGVATPFLCVYFVLTFERNYPRWALLLWAFMTGVIVDTFSNTPGVSAASLTLLGVLQPYILSPFIPRNSAENFIPSAYTLGFSQFVYYLLIMTLIYCIVFFSLEMFTFFNWFYWLECIGGSLLLTVIVVLVLENLRRP